MEINGDYYFEDFLKSGCASSDGTHIWGRNFDWTGSVPIIVKHVPEDGYSSISTCDFQNMTASPNVVPEGIANQMLAIAALYVPMDVIKEKGLCVADLEVNEGGMTLAGFCSFWYNIK